MNNGGTSRTETTRKGSSLTERQTLVAYGFLAGAWLLIGGWQLLEHKRVDQSAREALVNRARDISYSLSAVVRAQSWFGRIRQPRLEQALEGLVQSEEVVSVALLNATGDVVASAGEPFGLHVNDLPQTGIRWGEETVTFVNLIDLGAESDMEGTTRSEPIIVSPEGEEQGPPPRFRRGPPQPLRHSIERTSASVILILEFPPDVPTTGPGSVFREPPEGGERGERGPGGRDRGERDRREGRPDRFRPPLRQSVETTSGAVVVRMEFPPDTPTTGPGSLLDFRDEPRRRPPGPPRPLGRPPWMSKEEYSELLQKQGLHGFVLVVSSNLLRTEVSRDRGVRLLVMAIALIAVVGLGLAWRTLERSTRLQLRLVRASEMNAYLREMNVAAAGLAHETRNPLNIVRGLAQMIAQQDEALPDIRRRSREIMEEVDRVTGRLNEFIDYSRPREAKPTPTHLSAVVRDVERTLESDRTEKGIEFVQEGPELTVEADEALLRQIFFNLMLNAVQAVEPGGRVAVVVEKTSPHEAAFEVQDSGPGVPASAREDIFRPYFTSHKDGTGLGLAIVRQIVLAHGWEIEYIPGQNRGARFRISGLKVTSKAP